jgi:hypothetical protein
MPQSPFFTYCTTLYGGTEIPDKGTTSSTAVELGGSGPPKGPFVITDKGVVVSKPNREYNLSGAFHEPIENLAPGAHYFELRTNASAPATSKWEVTVVTAEQLAITSLKGLVSGQEINEGASTAETLFHISGVARANTILDLLDQGAAAELIAVDGNGRFGHNTSPQAAGMHSYTVRGRYDSNPQSTPPRTLTIASAATAPAITLVKATITDRPIANGRSTADTSIVLSGTAEKNTTVEIFDGLISKGPVSVDAQGDWKITLSGLSYDTHVFTAKNVSGGLVSGSHSVVITLIDIEYFWSRDGEIPEGKPFYLIPDWLIMMQLRSPPDTRTPFDVYINGVREETRPQESSGGFFQTPMSYRFGRIPGTYSISVGPARTPDIRCPPRTFIIAG